MRHHDHDPRAVLRDSITILKADDEIDSKNIKNVRRYAFHWCRSTDNPRAMIPVM